MGRRNILLLTVMFGLFVPGNTVAAQENSLQGRSFYMGFTPFPYDLTVEAVEDTYRLTAGHSDLIAHHLDGGVPWPEALGNKPYHPEVEGSLKYRLSKISPGQKVYVSTTPIDITRKGLANYWAKNDQMKRPGKWKGRTFNHPEVVQSYLNFSRDLIRRFKPNYFAYAIEANLLFTNSPKQWPLFVQLAREVYTALKLENPSLPIFITLNLDTADFDQAAHRKALQQVLPYTDYIAVSVYPYGDPSDLSPEFLGRAAELAPEKPFAVAETGFIAENLDSGIFKIPGKEQWQADYPKLLFEECNRRRAHFLVWFVHRDYDLLWQRWSRVGKSNELLKLWRDTGLIDGEGNRRKGLGVWDTWFALSRTDRE